MWVHEGVPLFLCGPDMKQINVLISVIGTNIYYGGLGREFQKFFLNGSQLIREGNEMEKMKHSGAFGDILQ